MAIKDRFIPREEISKLVEMIDNRISTYDLSMWVKSKTDDKWVVVPKVFCDLTIDFFERLTSKLPVSGSEELLENFKNIKKYL
jgi:hypothetical protein